jgi:hypothetical protein
VSAVVLRDREDRPRLDLRALVVVSFGLYLAVPHTFWATNFVYERFAMAIVLFAACAAPRVRPAYERIVEGAFVAIGALSALLFASSMHRASRELSDLDRLIDAAPPSERVIGVVYDPRTPSFDPPILLHAPALYVARRGGEAAFAFTRTMSLPLHYRASQIPPAVPFKFEWSPGLYRANTDYAARFPTIFLKTQRAEDSPQLPLKHAGIGSAKLLAHVGEYWLLRVERAR